jgi:hypothetical protein
LFFLVFALNFGSGLSGLRRSVCIFNGIDGRFNAELS